MDIHHCLWLFCLVTSSVRAGTGFNDKKDLHPNFHNTDWMALIPDETLISAVTIPGTHESLTFSKLQFAGNQVWTLEQQLRVGIRYFDIHAGMWLATKNEIRIRDDKWMIDQNIDLQSVLEQIRSFLRSHKNEAVVLKLRLHGFQKDKVSTLAKKIFEKFENFVWTKKWIPTMKKVRGKIVLLDTGVFHFGTQNKESKFFESNKLVNVEGKIDSMKLDFCGRYIVVTENPTTRFQNTKNVAKKVNQDLSEFLQRHNIRSSNHGCLGIISMDFPSPELIEKIIHLKPCNCRQTLGAGSKKPHESSSQTEETNISTNSGSPTTPQTSITPTSAQEPITTTIPQSNGQTTKRDEDKKDHPSPPDVLPGQPKLPTETGLDNTDWMMSIPDETPLSTITIAGIRLLFGKSKVWTMKQKLKDGIRYFDINVGVWRATEKEYDIRSTKWMVKEVLFPISIFLRTHHHETVLLRLTIHGRSKTIVEDFINTSTEKFKDITWTKGSVPTMKEARGKIVFLKTESFSFGAENHKSKILDSNMLVNFEKNTELLRSDICGGQLVVTESPASDHESLKLLSEFVQRYISSSSDFGCLGIISMDNPQGELINSIVHLRPCNCEQKLEVGSKKPPESSSQTEETKVSTNSGSPTTSSMVTQQPATEEQPKPQPQTSATQESITTIIPQSNGQTTKRDEDKKDHPSPPDVLPGQPKLPTSTGLDNSDLMMSIPDETPLSTITIAGIRLLFGKSKVWTMEQKLKDGIRYFDVNVGVWRATEKEYDIRSTKWMVKEVLFPISIFLRTHHHETVLLRLTIHGRSKTIVEDFINTSTEKFKDITWTKGSVPTMKEARGKIVFLKTESFSFGAENHKSKILDSNMLVNFEKNTELLRSDICGGQLVVTESPASDHESLKLLSEFVQRYISSSSDFGCLGIISMDDPQGELINSIVHLRPCDCNQTGGQLHSKDSTNKAKIKPISLPGPFEPHFIYVPMVFSMSQPIAEPQLVFRKCRRG